MPATKDPGIEPDGALPALTLAASVAQARAQPNEPAANFSGLTGRQTLDKAHMLDLNIEKLLKRRPAVGCHA